MMFRKVGLLPSNGMQGLPLYQRQASMPFEGYIHDPS